MSTRTIRIIARHFLLCFTVIVVFGYSRVYAQTVPGTTRFTIDASNPVTAPETGYLQMGSEGAGCSPGVRKL